MIHRLLLLCLAVLSLALAGCQGYDVKINERVVYSPAPLFTDFEVNDPALLACLEETIQHDTITRVEQLKTLNCSNAGIATLEGLATFAALTELRLSSNKIRNLVELHTLIRLRALYLDNNVVVDPVPLYALSNLVELDLSANGTLQCPKDNALDHITTLVLPQHCN